MSDEDTDENPQLTDEVIEKAQTDVADATLTVEFPLDDFHEMLVEEMETQTDLDLEQIVAANHIADVEQTLHQLYQNGKYSQ